MTVQEAINRGNNLASTVVVAAAGIAFAPELFLEDEWRYKLDDSLLFILALVAVSWYRRGRNRFERTVMPVLFALAGVAIKLGAILLEMKDKEDVGDDFGGIILFVITFAIVWWLYSHRQSAEQ